MIPIILHYCWFGGKPLEEDSARNLETWMKNNPGYEVMLWNEDNFNVNSSVYTRQAYEAHNFAFVSDVARLKALTAFGGIYMDTDVECVKSFNDLLCLDAFLGFEGTKFIATSTMGCTAHHPLFEEFLNLYENLPLKKPDGSIDSDTTVLRLTRLLLDKGLERNGKMQRVADVDIFPCDYFSPYDYVDGRLRKTENTYTIHWYSQSWLGIGRLRRILSQMFHRLTGKKLE